MTQGNDAAVWDGGQAGYSVAGTRAAGPEAATRRAELGATAGSEQGARKLCDMDGLRASREGGREGPLWRPPPPAHGD